MPFFDQNLAQREAQRICENEINTLKIKIQSLEAENRQLRKGYQNKMTSYIKTSHQLCTHCFKKVMNNQNIVV
jgi:hypothetical protein